MSYIINDEPRELVNKHIPFQLRKKFADLVTDGYKWSTILQENTPHFRTPRGKKRLLPEIKNVSTEFFFWQAIKNNEIPFECKFATNDKRSHNYLEIYNDDVLIHINQVQTKRSCGRKAFCRDRFLKPIYSYMAFDELEENSHYQHDDDRLYFQINHGYQTSTPQFITIGIPNKSSKFDAYVPVLEEYNAIEGNLPKSKIEKIDADFFNDAFQRFAEGDEVKDERKNIK
jgi:hypothetical protein